MNFEFTPEQKTSAEKLRRFVEEEIAPRASELDQADAPRRKEILLSNLRKLGRAGFLALNFPKKIGGAGAGALEWTLHAEIVAGACPATFLALTTGVLMACVPILKFGGESQIENHVLPVAGGEKIGAFAITEPEGGSDPAAMETRAEAHADGWILKGRKAFVTCAPFCDFVLVLAATKDEGGPGGMSLFLVDATTPGLERGTLREMMGNRGAALCDLHFENCRLGRSALIGKVDCGFGYAMHALQWGRLAAAVGAVAIGKQCLRHALEFAGKRKSRGKPLLKHQEVSFKIAQMHTMTDTGRLLTQFAAWSMDMGDADAAPNVSCAKVYTTESATKISSWAVQVLGGAGYMSDSPVERLYRDARAGELIQGATEIHRLLLAQEVLEKYGN